VLATDIPNDLAAGTTRPGGYIMLQIREPL